MRFQWIRPRGSEYAPSNFFALVVFCPRARSTADNSEAPTPSSVPFQYMPESVGSCAAEFGSQRQRPSTLAQKTELSKEKMLRARPGDSTVRSSLARRSSYYCKE